jgi:hypothetical protein
LSSETPSRHNLTWLGVFILVGVPGVALRLSGTHLDPIVAAIVFGIGIGGGAFLLSWAAEVAQVDISASLAIAVLALIMWNWRQLPAWVGLPGLRTGAKD